MGWPRKNDELRLYADSREKGAYFLLLTCNGIGRRGYEAIANVYDGPEPSLCGTSIGPDYLARTWAKRVEWSELPSEWQDAFRVYMDSDPDRPFIPDRIRGLWRVGNQPPDPFPPSRTTADLEAVDAKECLQCTNLVPRDREYWSDFCGEECRDEWRETYAHGWHPKDPAGA